LLAAAAWIAAARGFASENATDGGGAFAAASIDASHAMHVAWHVVRDPRADPNSAVGAAVAAAPGRGPAPRPLATLSQKELGAAVGANVELGAVRLAKIERAVQALGILVVLF
jgi:hypothetical protein